MNTGNTAPAAPRLDELRIMTFNMMGTRMGVDIRQVSQMLEPGHATQGLRVAHLHEGLSFGDRGISYRSPRVLLLKDEETAVMIDQLEDIVPVDLDSIRPLPSVFDVHMKNALVWGVALIEEEIVLLVDLFQLVAAYPLSSQQGGCR